MKKKSIIHGFIMIAGSLLFFSCSNNESAKSEANKTAEINSTEIASSIPADTIKNLNDSAEVKKEIGAPEKGEKEENEKNEKGEKD